MTKQLSEAFKQRMNDFQFEIVQRASDNDTSEDKPKTKKITAIGDVHGQYSKLCETLEPLFNSGKHLLFLGDLIDRGESEDSDFKVVKLVKDMNENPSKYGLEKVDVLMGNHEDFLLRLKSNPSDDKFELWQWNGGGKHFYEHCDEFLPWLDSRPIKLIYGEYLFVHAGIVPNVPLKKQKRNDMLWIREEFLDVYDHGLPYIVVHGHTITPDLEPEIYDHRIGIDTGGFLDDGVITAMEFEYTPKPDEHK